VLSGERFLGSVVRLQNVHCTTCTFAVYALQSLWNSSIVFHSRLTVIEHFGCCVICRKE